MLLQHTRRPKIYRGIDDEENCNTYKIIKREREGEREREKKVRENKRERLNWKN